MIIARVRNTNKQKITIPALLLLLFAQFAIVGVRAQTTSVTVQFPESVTISSVAHIDVTVTYSGTNILIVAIYNPSMGVSVDAVQSAVDVSSSPDNCLPMVAYAGKAVCAIVETSGSGTENLKFDLTAPSYSGDWSLTAGAGAVTDTNSNFQLISSSISLFPFTIHVTDMAMLSITLPPSIHAQLDGTDQGSGSFQTSLIVGDHAISVPLLVPVDANTRLEFNGWSDGVGSNDRTLDLTSDTALTANYVKQYMVTTTSPLAPTTTEWYDDGSGATFTTPTSPQPTSDITGVLGGKLVFDGWYENGQLISDSPSASAIVSGPILMEARWHADYTIPMAIIAALAVAIGVVAFFVVRKSNNKSGKRRRRRR